RCPLLRGLSAMTPRSGIALCLLSARQCGEIDEGGKLQPNAQETLKPGAERASFQWPSRIFLNASLMRCASRGPATRPSRRSEVRARPRAGDRTATTTLHEQRDTAHRLRGPC